MKRLLLGGILIFSLGVRAQQYALYNTKTLFDAFENPARNVYTQDTSRQFSFNILPNFGLNLVGAGPVQADLRKAISTSVYSAKDLAIGANKVNRGFVNFNAYMAMARVYTSVLKHGEAGFSWQVRSDGYAKITNETLAIIDTYKLFDTLANYSNIFNNRAHSISYQQVSFTYRQNINHSLGVGVKLSYLSGILYNGLTIDSSSIGPDFKNETYEMYLSGKVKSSFNYHDGSRKSNNNLFSNPGFSATVAFTNRLKHGWNIYGQLKDIGFIRWNRAPVYAFKGPVTLKGTSSSHSPRIGSKIDSMITQSHTKQSFYTPVNSKVELVISKDYAHYQASALVSKNLTNFGGDIGLIQNARWRSLNIGLTTVYSPVNAFQIGLMGMIKTPNFEIFAGSDQLFKTKAMLTGIINDSESYTSGYSGASIYMGIGFNFGKVMEHPLFSSRTPQIN
jgi:hypothetical protein